MCRFNDRGKNTGYTPDLRYCCRAFFFLLNPQPALALEVIHVLCVGTIINLAKVNTILLSLRVYYCSLSIRQQVDDWLQS